MKGCSVNCPIDACGCEDPPNPYDGEEAIKLHLDDYSLSVYLFEMVVL